MSALLTNVISIRSEDYEVSEIDGKTMKVMRKLLTGDNEAKEEVEPRIALACCVKPKFKTMDELLALPSFVISQIANEAYRLSGLGSAEPKNG